MISAYLLLTLTSKTNYNLFSKSSFTPINQTKDEDYDIEEHTRELQIEMSFKIFEEALKYQKEKNFPKSNSKYDVLFKISVIKEFNYSGSPTIENLKYLSLRNRGFLKLSELIKDCDEYYEKNQPTIRSDDGIADESVSESEDEDELTRKEDLFDRLLSAIDDLVRSLAHGKGDIKLIELLFQIFNFYNLKRLARLIVEFELLKTTTLGSKNTNNDEISVVDDDDLNVDLHNSNGFLLPNQLNLLKDYQVLLENLDDVNNLNFLSLNKINKMFTDKNGQLRLNFKKKKVQFDKVISKHNFNRFRKMDNDVIELSLNKYDNRIDIVKFLKDLNEILPKSKGKSKYYDSYILSEVPIEKIELNLIERKVESLAMDIKEPDDDDIEEVAELDGNDDIETVEANEVNENSNNDLNNEKKESNSTLTPAQRIASKRLSRSKTDVEAVELKISQFDYQNNFLHYTLRLYLSFCGDTNIPIEHLIEITMPSLSNNPESIAKDKFTDFSLLLNDWNNEQTESLLVKLDDDDQQDLKNGKVKDSSSSIKEILSSKSIETNFERKVTLEDLDDGGLLALVSKMNDSQLHLNQIKMLLVDHFFKFDEKSGGNLITNGFVNEEAIQNLKLIVDAVGLYVFKSFNFYLMNFKEFDMEKFKHNLSISISILEILVDYYISIKLELKLKRINRSAINDFQLSEEVTFNRINDWVNLIEDYFGVVEQGESQTINRLWIRFNWCKVSFIQQLPDFNTDELSSTLIDISNRTKHDLEFDILMVNYHNIPRLNNSSIDDQISKMRIFKTFTDDDTSNRILKSVLGDSADQKSKYAPEGKEIDHFITNSPIELKLRLWMILFKYYKDNKLFIDYQIGFQKVMELILDEFNKDEYKVKSRYSRSQLILRLLGFFSLFAQDYINCLSKNNWRLGSDDESKHRSLIHVVEFFKLSYMFLIHEDLCKIMPVRKSLKSKSLAAYNKLNEITILSFTLLAIYYTCNLKVESPEHINDFYAILHEQLGYRHICNKLNGMYLNYIEFKLVELAWNQSDNDFFQTIRCHYDMSITIDAFSTFDHGVDESCPMEIQNAISVSKYLLGYCFKKRHPMFNVPKNDIKNLLDLCYEVIGDIDLKEITIRKNSLILNNYLDNQQLNVRFIRFAFYGLLSIDIEKPDVIMTDSAIKGLYFMQGLMSLTLFKIRKRTMQGRSAELDFVIKMFEFDLLCGSNRFETWLLLGQTYSYLVEDDIIWTSDKLNNDEKKRNTAFLQRKSLLCYLMAINIYSKIPDNKKAQYDQIAAIMWSSFGKELYGAINEPMSKLAFYSIPANVSISSTGDLLVDEANKIEINSISKETVFKILTICFKQSTKLNSKDWFSFYLLSKVQAKLDNKSLVEPSIKNILQACRLALKFSNKDDPIIEPHYYLCSLVYKLVTRKKLSVAKGVEYLYQDSLLKGKGEDLETNKVLDIDQFGQFVISSLRKCITYDKKNWQHKTRYRVAKIYLDQFHDVTNAKKEMSTIINLKPSVRNLSNIWKPENERPGKHFVYNFDYIKFFVELLDKSNDIYSLICLIRKLRKLGSSMINQVKVFDYAVVKACSKIKRIVKIKKNFIDDFLSKMVYSDFISSCKKFVEHLQEKKEYTYIEKITLFFLSEVADFRRMANGFGATGVIDDCYHSLFLSMLKTYLAEQEEEQQVPEHSQDKLTQPSTTTSENPATQIDNSIQKQITEKPIHFFNNGIQKSAVSPATPTREKVKVARRDITPFCLQLVAHAQDLISALKKDLNDGNPLVIQFPDDSDDEVDDIEKGHGMMTPSKSPEAVKTEGQISVDGDGLSFEDGRAKKELDRGTVSVAAALNDDDRNADSFKAGDIVVVDTPTESSQPDTDIVMDSAIELGDGVGTDAPSELAKDEIASNVVSDHDVKPTREGRMAVEQEKEVEVTNMDVDKPEGDITHSQRSPEPELKSQVVTQKAAVTETNQSPIVLSDSDEELEKRVTKEEAEEANPFKEEYDLDRIVREARDRLTAAGLFQLKPVGDLDLTETKNSSPDIRKDSLKLENNQEGTTNEQEEAESQVILIGSSQSDDDPEKSITSMLPLKVTPIRSPDKLQAKRVAPSKTPSKVQTKISKFFGPVSKPGSSPTKKIQKIIESARSEVIELNSDDDTTTSDMFVDATDSMEDSKIAENTKGLNEFGKREHKEIEEDDDNDKDDVVEVEAHLNRPAFAAAPPTLRRVSRRSTSNGSDVLMELDQSGGVKKQKVRKRVGDTFVTLSTDDEIIEVHSEASGLESDDEPKQSDSLTQI